MENIELNNNDNFFWGSDNDDLIVGGDGNDTLIGSLNRYSQGVNNGLDIIYGDTANPGAEISGFNDLIIGGIESDPFPDGDDELSGGGGNDTIYGIGHKDFNRILSSGDRLTSGGWIDDAVEAGVKIWKFTLDNFGRAIDELSPLSYSKNIYEGDRLYGNQGKDVLVLGKGDVSVDKGADDIIYRLKGINLRQVSGNFNKSLALKKTSPTWGDWNLQKVSDEFSPDNFTTNAELHSYTFGQSERDSGDEVIKLPIYQDEEGNVLLLFEKGATYLASDGSYFFISKDDRQNLNSGDFGINYTAIEGNENYYIGSYDWIRDLRTEFANEFGQENADFYAVQVQSWLREALYPLLHGFQKPIENDGEFPTGYAYIEYDVNSPYYGQEFALYYDDTGQEYDPFSVANIASNNSSNDNSVSLFNDDGTSTLASNTLESEEIVIRDAIESLFDSLKSTPTPDEQTDEILDPLPMFDESTEFV